MPSTLPSRIHKASGRPDPDEHLVLGYRVLHDVLRLDQPIVLPHTRRHEHVAILGKTGTGKSSLLRFLFEQDIRADRSFVFFDLHGDATPTIAQLVAEAEAERGEDLSRKLIVFDPADREYSLGINVLGADDEQGRFVQLAEITRILRDRWQLESFGARTEELLRNALQVLQDNGLTIVELGPLLTDAAFRARCIAETKSPEARAYFTRRYTRLSDGAQAEYREAVLNKASVFTADPHFRHILGQAESTVDLSAVAEGGFWLVFNLDKGRLGEQVATLGSLLLTRLTHSLFARHSRDLLTVYCDELQNLVTLSGGMDTLMAESRKLGLSVVTANQYLDQYPLPMQAAVLAVGTLVFLQVSGLDAERISASYGRNPYVAHQLRNLPPRQMLIKKAGLALQRAGVPELAGLQRDPENLLRRSQQLWGSKRIHIEEEIALRLQGGRRRGKDLLDGWE